VRLAIVIGAAERMLGNPLFFIGRGEVVARLRIVRGVAREALADVDAWAVLIERVRVSPIAHQRVAQTVQSEGESAPRFRVPRIPLDETLQQIAIVLPSLDCS